MILSVARATNRLQLRESAMTTGEMLYLGLVLATFGIFGIVAFWLSTEEGLSLRRAGMREQALRIDRPVQNVELPEAQIEFARAA
jgi:hypothetical protein